MKMDEYNIIAYLRLADRELLRRLGYKVVNKQKHGDLILCSIPPIVYDAIRLHDTIEAYRANMTLLEFLEKVLGPNK